MIKVLLVEDQRLFREGIEAIINAEDDIEVIGMAEDGQEALKKVKELQPDIVLMDINMPNMDGIISTGYIKEHFESVKVVLLTSHAEKELVVRGISVGADGFLLKGMYKENLIWSIRNAAKGEMVLSGDVAKILVTKVKELALNKKQILAQKLENRDLIFTKRELDIAHLFMEGKTNKQIATKLFLGEGTVKNYISEIYNKVGIRNRGKAMEYFNGIMRK